jgi:hypothetical protein
MEKKFKSKFGNKVSFLNKYDYDKGKSIWYKISCDCGSDDHGATIEIEYDKEINMLFLHFYKEVEYAAWWFWKDDNFLGKIKDIYNCIIKRIKGSIKLLFTGRLEMEDEFILSREDHINDFIEALQEGKEYCKEENSGDSGLSGTTGLKGKE